MKSNKTHSPLQLIFDAFSLLHFKKTCILQGVKKRNMLLFSTLHKKRLPVISDFSLLFFLLAFLLFPDIFHNFQ